MLEAIRRLDGLKDVKAQLRIVVRLRLTEAGNLGDWKSVGGEAPNIRIAFGPGYRLYFAPRVMPGSFIERIRLSKLGLASHVTH